VKKFISTLVLSVFFFANLAWSGSGEEVLHLQNEWAQAMYQDQGKLKENHLASLADIARSLAAQNPKDPEILIWKGIVVASYAGNLGGLGALSLVKEAKSNFENAIALNPKALEGSAYTSLGSLYYQVPGWPLGFGDDKKAEDYLKMGLSINPNGIDPNYFYADFLFRAKRYDEADVFLRKALQAPPRLGRELADEGRKKEISVLISKIKLARN
jgi:tetratricopeptide (TPR) repeat protein